MPIYLKEEKKNQALPGSSGSETTKLKQLVVLLQQQLNKMTKTIRELKNTKSKLEADVTRRDTEIKRLKGELQRITKGRYNDGSDFGSF